MTTKTKIPTPKVGKLLRFPDCPPRDDMQNWLYLYEDSATSSLIIHFGNSPDVIVANEVPLRSRLPVSGAIRIPDLMVIFGANRALMELQRGFEIALQGKAPDFILEVASHTTGVVDYTAKRSDYESYGALEYWRFDPTGGEYHDAPLAGDRLIDGRYRPIPVETLPTARFADTAKRWACTYAGRTENSDSTTPSPAPTSAPTEKKPPAPPPPKPA